MRFIAPLLLTTAIVMDPPSASAADRPNIILILCDDMGYSDIGCYDGEIQTPNLDRLAANGIRYSQMYNTSKCTSTRSALMTGRYVNGISTNPNHNMGPTLGEVLKPTGYRTLWSGKNHSSMRPPKRGFDRFDGFQGGACNFWNPGDKLRNGDPLPYIKAYEWMVDDKWVQPYIPENPDYFMTHAITDNALAWLDEYTARTNPTFSTSPTMHLIGRSMRHPVTLPSIRATTMSATKRSARPVTRR